MDGKKSFGESMEERLAAYKAKIEAARNEAREKGPDFFERWTVELERLLEKYDKARYKLTLLRKGGGDALTELRDGFEHAMTDLKTSLTKAKSKF